MTPTHIIELKMEEIAPKALWFNVILLAAFAAAYHFLNEPLSFYFSLSGILLFLIGYLLLIVAHEIFHLIGFVVFGKVPVSSLNYGLNLKLGVAYATTNKPLQNHAMRKAAAFLDDSCSSYCNRLLARQPGACPARCHADRWSVRRLHHV